MWGEDVRNDTVNHVYELAHGFSRGQLHSPTKYEAAKTKLSYIKYMLVLLSPENGFCRFN